MCLRQCLPGCPYSQWEEEVITRLLLDGHIKHKGLLSQRHLLCA